MQIVFNWHLTELCNFACKYCFAKWGTTEEIWKSPLVVQRLFAELATSKDIPLLRGIQSGGKHRVRINFVGGEPLVLGDNLLQIIERATQYGFEASIVTNGSLLPKNIGVVKLLSTLGFSVDSFSSSTNQRIGRCHPDGSGLAKSDFKAMVQEARAITGR